LNKQEVRNIVSPTVVWLRSKLLLGAWAVALRTPGTHPVEWSLWIDSVIFCWSSLW